ncbi:MAG: ATP-binding protein [Geminicoccaceae bacterium]
MRLNPFSQSVGKRRAAMIRGDASDESASEVETEEELVVGLPLERDVASSVDDGKQFGFAYRSELERNDVPAEQEARHPHETHTGDALIHGEPAAGSSGQEEPIVDTPHIERLRAQIGVDAADTIEPYLPEDETIWTERAESRTAPIATDPGPSVSPPLRKPNAAHDAVRPPIEPAPRIDPAPPFLAGNDVISAESVEHEPVAPAVEQELVDPFEDVAVTIGRIVSIRGSVIWGALFDDIDGQAARAARMGTLVSMRGPDSRVFGIVNRLEREQQAGSAQSERTVFEVQVLGEIADDRTGFQRGVSSYPPLDAPVTTITVRDIATIYARPRCSNVHIGQLRHNPKVPAFVLTDSLLGKHFAVLGTTGTGKSCATTVVLRSILDEHPQGHVVLIDPHNEYGAAFADRAELLNPSNLHLPYWLLNFEEIAHIILGGGSRDQMDSQATLLKNAIIQAKTQFVGGRDECPITVDTPVPYRLSDLMSALKDAMGMFNKAEGSALYLGLINRIESLAVDQRYGFMFSSLAVRDNMEQILAQLLRIPTNGKPMTIIDISGLPSEVVDVVVSVLFRLTFELAVWSERGKAPPVLLVCEEAHRYVPEESDVGFAPTKRVIAQIAKEGRKYGVTLCLVSQRPSELSVSSLAQCNTIFALRMSNEHDQAFVSQTLSENARWLVDSLPSLNTQEAVVVGDGVTVPVHIRFKDLPPAHRPASHDPSYAKSWSQEADTQFLGSAIDRWRRQTR